MTDWTEVREAVEASSLAYRNMLKTREDVRADSTIARQAEEAWADAHEARRNALLAQWDEAEDGTLEDGSPSIGGVLRRYYLYWWMEQLPRAPYGKTRRKERSKW